MKRSHALSCVMFIALGLMGCEKQTLNEAISAGPIHTELQLNDGHYQIIRDGKPYFIRGAGGRSYLAKLKASGANTVRTWGTDGAEALLDEAQKQGLSVMLGLRLGHERHGYDYDDATAVQKQFEDVKAQVLKFKDHPALLAWGIGNEVDLFYTNTKVWYAVEDIAKMIKAVDPHHLVTTVTAGIDKQKADLIMQRVPSIDYLSINIYGGLETLPQHLLDIGYTGAYVVTEWGPTGHWQVPRTEWDVPIEQTSTEKATSYRSRYEGGVLSAPERALGSFAFLWGQKQETTPTWYGVFTESGHPNEVVDSLQYLWTGSWPQKRAPSIEALTINGEVAKSNVYLEAGESAAANVEIIERSHSTLHIRWEILPESTDIKAGGDPEDRPHALGGLFTLQRNGQLQFIAPSEGGAYRLFVYVTDEQGKVATGNIPFFVREASKV